MSTVDSNSRFVTVVVGVVVVGVVVVVTGTGTIGQKALMA
jgi:hypothetical protein